FAALISEVDLNPTGSKTGDPSDSKVATGIVDLPLNITEDRLLGGLDLDRTIASGKPQVSPGVLAAANGRVLLVHDINLLETSACGHLAERLIGGTSGLRERASARFTKQISLWSQRSILMRVSPLLCFAIVSV